METWTEAARGVIRDNIEAMGLFGSTRVHRRDATDLWLAPSLAGAAFDLAFLDPPYRKGLGEARRIWPRPLDLGRALAVSNAPATSRPGDRRLGDPRRPRYGAARVVFLKATS